MHTRALIVAAFVLPCSLAAQSPAGAPPRTSSVMYAFETFADRFGSLLVAAFDSIPAARYAYRPTPTQQSIGYIAQHLEDANYQLCENLGTLRHPRSAKDSLADTVKALWPKDTLVARLRASIRFCETAMAGLDQIESSARASTLLAFETDLAEHYSQLASYMRQLGMVPPSALPPQRRTAIDLPPSALLPYAGVYELGPELQLEITTRDGALLVRSTGGATVRLWPERGGDFFIREADASITFTRDASGAVTGLVVHRYGRARVAKRVP